MGKLKGRNKKWDKKKEWRKKDVPFFLINSMNFNKSYCFFKLNDKNYGNYGNDRNYEINFYCYINLIKFINRA